jgi:hypothetical protein
MVKAESVSAHQKHNPLQHIEKTTNKALTKYHHRSLKSQQTLPEML